MDVGALFIKSSSKYIQIHNNVNYALQDEINVIPFGLCFSLAPR